MEPQDLKNELIKLSPPAGVSMTTVLGVPLSDWVYIVTIIYTMINCGILLYKTLNKEANDVDKE